MQERFPNHSSKLSKFFKKQHKYRHSFIPLNSFIPHSFILKGEIGLHQNGFIRGEIPESQ